MRRQLFAVLLAVALLAAGLPAASGQTGSAPTAAQAQDCSFPVTVTDATGAEVTVDADPDRVVVSAASGAQTMWEIGASDKVVGMPVKSYTTYLPGASEKTEVTGAIGYMDTEKVIAQNPDLVLAANISKSSNVETLREAGIPVYKFRLAGSISDIYAKTNRTGKLTGNCGAARDRVAQMRDQIEVVREAVNGTEPVDVYYHMGGGYTALPGSFVHDVLTTAGGYNIAAELNTSAYGRVSKEVVVDADPQYIVRTYTGEAPDDPAAGLPAAFNNTTAVREGNVIAVNGNHMSQPAPRVTGPLVKLTEAFHPDAYAAANVSAQTNVNFSTAAANGTDTTESGGLPGFGAPVAGLALLGGALVAARRAG